jgi:hypothetical protein
VSKGLQAAIVGVGVALWIPAILAAWKAASMRSDLNRDWHDRIDLAINGLSEKAARTLLEIQRLIRDFVVEGSVTFDPIRVVREPSDLEEPMKRFLKILGIRDRTRGRYRRLLWMGPGLLVSAVVYAIGVLLAVADISELYDRPVLGRVGVAMGLVGGIGLLSGFSMYAYLQHKLSGAEILSQNP